MMAGIISIQKRGFRLQVGIIPAIVVLALFVGAGIFADFIVPHNPIDIDLAKASLPPFWQQGGTPDYLLGTDRLGRDILSRIIYGARISLVVAFLGVVGSCIIGAVLGMIAGYKGGQLDNLISRVTDIMLGMPLILVALVLAITMGASLLNVVIVIVLTFWAVYCRQARSETLKVREMDFVTLARTAGCRDFVIMWRHILPNIANSLIVLATFNVGSVITLEATLSFLGLGVPPPWPAWGGMTADGRDLIVSAWWLTFMPGTSITLVVLAGNLFGDWLRDRLDPKLRNF